MAAAACREESEGDLGEGGLGREESALIDILRGLACSGEPDTGDVEGGSEFRSGDIARAFGIVAMPDQVGMACWRVGCA